MYIKYFYSWVSDPCCHDESFSPRRNRGTPEIQKPPLDRYTAIRNNNLKDNRPPRRELPEHAWHVEIASQPFQLILLPDRIFAADNPSHELTRARCGPFNYFPEFELILLY